MHGWYRGAQEPRPQAAPAPNRSIAPGPRAREKSRYLRGEWSQHLGIVLQVFGSSRVFNLHIAKFFGIEDLATLQALDILSVVVPGNDPDLWVSAGGCHRSFSLLLPRPLQSWNSRPSCGRAAAPLWLLPFGSAGFRVWLLGNGYRCSFRQIVAVFCPIANRFFDESGGLTPGTNRVLGWRAST
jgi:hypothetical protein